jgi:hypothetical protein
MMALVYARTIQANPTIFKHQEIHISTPIGIMLGHMVCKYRVKVDMEKIKIILDLNPPMNQKQIKIFLGHTGYYRKFMCHYSDITFPMDELLSKRNRVYMEPRL